MSSVWQKQGDKAARYNESALEKFRAKHQLSMDRVIQKNCKPHDFDDIRQQLFMNFLMNPPVIKQNEEGFDKSCAFYSTKYYYHCNSIRAKYLQEYRDTCKNQLCDFKTPDQSLEEKEVSEIFHAQIDNLPEIYRDLLTSVDLGGEPLEAYANRVGINYNTAKIRHKRALELCREKMSPYTCISE